LMCVTCFSGAAPVKVRKVSVLDDRQVVILKLQWGRTREGAEGAERSTRCCSPVGRFSGAAPVKVRKAVAQAAEINANLRASVGPHP